MALDAGALVVMNELLSHQKKALRKEVAWCISNITAGPEHQIQAVIDSGVIDQLIHMMQNDDWEIRKEACWAVSNCTASANPHQILALVQKQSLKAIGAMMTGKESRQLMVVLEALENILKCGEEHFKDSEGNN